MREVTFGERRPADLGKIIFSIEEKYFYVNCSTSLSLILISSFKILLVAFLSVDFLREVCAK